MAFYINIGWVYFCIFFGTMLLINFVMSRLGENMYTLHVVTKKLSIIDLQFPASALELSNLIRGIFLLPAKLSKKSLAALKGQLYIDFLFMPAAYGSVFILCMKVSMKMTYFGHGLFATLAWLQLIPFLCDIVENIYLLNKLKPDSPVSSPTIHSAYLALEILKWGLSLTGAICSISAMFYFWIVGRYSAPSVYFLLIIIAAIIIVLIAKKITTVTDKTQLEKFQHGAA